ncbi:MAG: radical SAM protein [Firmicutes bacterium]|nr:radical SAM protein [Bacillota bacterium]
MKFNVIEIFDSIEGEGIRQGLPATFIRLGGCNLSCNWCDTKYACNPKNFIEMDLDKIVARVNPNYKRVTLTGGEPLLHKGVKKLIKALIKSNIEINIETNGSINISDFIMSYEMLFTIDYKLPSSGESNKMLWDNYTKHISDEEDNYNDLVISVKFVIGSDNDLLAFAKIAEDIIAYHRSNNSYMPKIFATVVAEQFDPKKLADYILQNPILKDVCMQVQLHKAIGVK